MKFIKFTKGCTLLHPFLRTGRKIFNNRANSAPRTRGGVGGVIKFREGLKNFSLISLINTYMHGFGKIGRVLRAERSYGFRSPGGLLSCGGGLNGVDFPYFYIRVCAFLCEGFEWGVLVMVDYFDSVKINWRECAVVHIIARGMGRFQFWTSCG
jgi:hypothetical protein